MVKAANVGLSKILKSALTFVIVLFAFLCLNSHAMADEGGYTITNYDFHGILHKNNVMDATETITVNFTEPRHGIYRYINTFYSLTRDASDAGDGSDIRKMSYFADVKDPNVIGDIFSQDHRDSSTNVYCLQIGDEDKTITGEKTYEISYRYVMRDDRISSSDFFFYSVLGSGWQTDISKFSFSIDFEEPLPESAVKGFKIYSGPYGTEDNLLNVQAVITEDGISGTAEKIGPDQSITLYTDLPEGYFTGEETTDSSVFLIFMVPAVLLALVLLIVEFVKKDKDPVITVEFYPPEGISPAEIGTIVDEFVNDQDVLSLIPYWADQGYLEIRAEEQAASKSGETSMSVIKKKDLPDDAPGYQIQLFSALFRDRSQVRFSNLGEDFVNTMDTVKLALNKKYSTGEQRLSKGGLKAAIFCLLDCALYGVALACTSKIDILDNTFWGGAAALALSVVFLGQILNVNANHILSSSKKTRSIIVLSLFMLAALYVTVFQCAGPDSYLPRAISILCFVPVAAAMFFSGNLVHATEYKRSLIGKVLGFREFIQTAEISRLKVLNDEDPAYYYHILPYAMAFDLSDQWTSLFKDLDLTQPSWYTCYGTSMFNAVYFSHSLIHGVSDSIRDTRSSMSSSSGGGFSGGGGGGGGGGSW